MQQRQQHEGVQKNPSISHGTETRLTKAIAPNSAKVAESPYFDRRNQRINSTKGRTDKDGASEGKNYDALNGFLRNQIELTTYADGKVGNKRSNTNNAVIEAAAQLKAKGTREQVMDYVRSASAHSKSQVGHKNVGLSRMKITAKNKADDKKLAAEFDTSSDAAAVNPFVHKNRELHTNSVFKSGYNAHQNSDDQQFSPLVNVRGAKTPNKAVSNISAEDALNR